MSNKNEKKGILLETGTNELEIVSFKIGNEHYGINVAKVREIRRIEKCTKMPHQHPSILGIFKLRGSVVPVIDLAAFLDLEADSSKKGNTIITEFNSQQFGFVVDYVDRIYRISWEDIEPPSDLTISKNNVVITGVIKMKDFLIQLLDFEYIVAEINPSVGLTEASHHTIKEHKGRGNINLLIAEDSDILRRLLKQTLEKAGFHNVEIAINGREAWDKLLKIRDKYTNSNALDLDLIITDIEMPQMDGLHLTKLIKDDTILKSIPVIVFSSLISPEMQRKCKKVGSTREITKPEVNTLVDVIDEVLKIKKM